MTVPDWMERLLSMRDRQRQRALLETHQADLTPEFFEEIKARSDALALEEPRRALEIAEVATLAASFAAFPLGDALAHWARGNALLCLEQHERALDDYDRALTCYQEQGQDEHRLEIARLQTNMVAVLKSLGRYTDALALADAARITLEPWGQSRYMATLEMNVGSLYRHLGRYSEALEAYERGRTIFAALGDTVQAARMDVNRARLLGILDRFREAETLLQAAHDTLAAEGAALPAARAGLNRATLLSRQGQHRQALEMYRRVRAAFAVLGVEADVATVDLYASYDYLALNLLPEAEDLSAAAHDVLSGQDMARYVALANRNRAVAARKQEHYTEALDGLNEARAFFAGQGVAVEAALLDLERATCWREMGDSATAITVATEAGRVLIGHNGQEGYNLPFQAARARLVLAGCLLASGDVDQSAILYDLALDTLREMPSLAWEAYDGLGQVAEARGQLPAAVQYYRQAVACIETAEDVLGSAEFRAGFLEDKLDVYRRAVRVALALGEQEQAFRFAEQSKTGVWRDYLAQPEEKAEMAEERPRLHRLRRQWYWLYHRLIRPDEEEEPSPEGDTGIDDHQRGSESEQAYWDQLRALELQIAQVRRESAPLLRRRSELKVSAVQQRMPEGTLLLDYYCTDEAVSVFVIGKSAVHALVDLAPLRDVKRQISRWRFNLESARMAILDGRPATRLADEAHAILHGLHQLLVEPLEVHLTGNKSLWIGPHAVLWAIPFAALYDGEHYMIERYTLTCLPGVIGLESPGQRATSALTDAPLIVGYSDGERLSYVVSEAQAVAAALSGGELLLEEEATTEQLRSAASSCTLLHLATHGFFREDAPLFSALHLADDLLTAEKLEGWRMPRVELVTLSACESGVSLSRGSDLLGLARGFWRAGARRLVVSLWAVDDVSTADLMVHFYGSVRKGQSASLALRSAQVAALAKYRHPFYWAGFEAMELF